MSITEWEKILDGAVRAKVVALEAIQMGKSRPDARKYIYYMSSVFQICSFWNIDFQEGEGVDLFFFNPITELFTGTAKCSEKPVVAPSKECYFFKNPNDASSTLLTWGEFYRSLDPDFSVDLVPLTIAMKKVRDFCIRFGETVGLSKFALKSSCEGVPEDIVRTAASIVRAFKLIDNGDRLPAFMNITRSDEAAKAYAGFAYLHEDHYFEIKENSLNTESAKNMLKPRIQSKLKFQSEYNTENLYWQANAAHVIKTRGTPLKISAYFDDVLSLRTSDPVHLNPSKERFYYASCPPKYCEEMQQKRIHIPCCTLE